MSGTIRLEHVGIRTTADRFEDTINFYVDNFGWKVIRRQPDQTRWAFIGDGAGGRFEIVSFDDGEPIPHPNHLAFSVPYSEFDNLKARLEGAGIRFDLEEQNPDGDRVAFCCDPGGNRVQIVGRIKAFDEEVV